jgi:protein-disulfide isomerase
MKKFVLLIIGLIFMFGCLNLENTSKINNTSNLTNNTQTPKPVQNSTISNNASVQFSLKRNLIEQAIGSGLKEGNESSKVVLIEFTDYQCPFCRRAHFITLPQLKEKYVQSGKVEYIKKDLPITAIHSQAEAAAEGVRCAQEQNKGWQMHDELFRIQDEVGGSSTVFFGPTDIKFVANKTGLQMENFNECFDTQKYKQQIKDDVELAKKLGFSGTPSYLIVKRGTEDAIPVIGAQGAEVFSSIIDEMLKN